MKNEIERISFMLHYFNGNNASGCTQHDSHIYTTYTPSQLLVNIQDAKEFQCQVSFYLEFWIDC